MSEKPHHGRIKVEVISTKPADYFGSRISGEFLDHPTLRGYGRTSTVVSYDPATGEIETRSSRYTLVTEGEPSRFRDFPMKGDKMRFIDRNGYDFERAEARIVFKAGAEYEVEDCKIGDWSHSVKFVGIDHTWNGIMFERVS